MRAADSGERSPPLDEQRAFWDRWNASVRFRALDLFMQAQRDVAVTVAADLGLRSSRILDVGCGTGWLGNALLPFGTVWAVDFSEASVTEGRQRHPGVRFELGDFMTVELPSRFDFIVSADAINNIYDPAGFVRRIAALLTPGGTLLLMTPNREVWRRRSALAPLGHGQVQRWPSVRQYRELLEPYFRIERFKTIDPGGDTGLLWWVENRRVRQVMRLLVGSQRWRAVLERAGLGRECVFIARRR